jgi:hypothetical protein
VLHYVTLYVTLTTRDTIGIRAKCNAKKCNIDFSVPDDRAHSKKFNPDLCYTFFRIFERVIRGTIGVDQCNRRVTKV